MPKKGNQVVGAVVQTVPVPSGSKKNKRKKNKTSTMSSGTLRLPSKTEILATVKIPVGAASVKGHFDFDLASIPYLGRFKDLFERWTVLSLKLEFKTACPTTQGGLFQMGVDWASLLNDKDRSAIAQLQPTVGGSVYTKSITLNVPSAKLMSRKFYSTTGSSDQVDKSPCRILYCAECSFQTKTTSDFLVGEIWATYTVQLLDPRPA